ncbi:MAG: hypothetical protein AMXMBFR72_11520 [Betaproteobacteria bacterium]|jgi:dipeptidyl aminopeptidase/acylaminoacyl peptidase
MLLTGACAGLIGCGGDSVAVSSGLAGSVQNGLIAFPGRDTQGRQQLFTIAVDGGGRKQFTFEPENSLPNWSPDGKHLAYVSRTASGPVIMVMDEDGRNKRALVPGDAPDWEPTTSSPM